MAEAGPPGKVLPSKENALFKSIVKFYETKQYKKGLKAADTILKKFAEHGETLAMKGLILNCLNRKAEGYECVRKGLKYDLKSHVCWHVYGLLYRSDRDYNEAIKCYRNALKLDKENLQILRDLGLLQIQMRDIKGFVETKRSLLSLKSNNRNHWIGFAVALHLAGKPSSALRVLQAYEGTLDEITKPDFEHSEMLLYKISVQIEEGDAAGALAELLRSEKLILDRLAFLETKAQLLLSASPPRSEEARAIYTDLLRLNPEHKAYYAGIEKCLHVSAADNEERLLEFYDSMQQQFPQANTCRRLALDVASGPRFASRLDAYVRGFLRKGVPSLFNDLKSLYKDSAKVTVIEDLFLGFERSLRDCGRFDSSPGDEEPRSSILWVWYFLAQHADRVRNTARALWYTDLALQHTPTVPDFYLAKARIYKHAGDLVSAHVWADRARTLDLADRFLNTKATLYALRAGLNEVAERTVALFTKEGEGSTTAHHLFEMQCMWYELEVAECFERASLLASQQPGGNANWIQSLGRSLKAFRAVDTHFTDIIEDQFDFHTYCLRKMTLRAYVRMLRVEDNLRSHRFFVRAALGLVRCYLALHDRPAKGEADENDAEFAGLSESEKKKLLSKKRREAARIAERKTDDAPATSAPNGSTPAAAQTAQASGTSTQTSASSKTGKGNQKKRAAIPVDPDPLGAQLTQIENPLQEASRFTKLLCQHAPHQFETHAAAFEVAMRKDRILLSLAALKRMAAYSQGGPSHPEVHLAAVRFLSALNAARAKARGTDCPLDLLRVLSLVDLECSAEVQGGSPTVMRLHEWLSSLASSASTDYAQQLPTSSFEPITTADRESWRGGKGPGRACRRWQWTECSRRWAAALASALTARSSAELAKAMSLAPRPPPVSKIEPLAPRSGSSDPVPTEDGQWKDTPATEAAAAIGPGPIGSDGWTLEECLAVDALMADVTGSELTRKTLSAVLDTSGPLNGKWESSEIATVAVITEVSKARVEFRKACAAAFPAATAFKRL